MSEYRRVLGVDELPTGRACSVSVDGTDVALFNVNGEFFALANSCPHRGGPLGEGDLEGDVVTCPWHGYQFNVKTGKTAEGGDLKASTFAVKLEGSDVLVSLK